jgi:hypothetical protein
MCEHENNICFIEGEPLRIPKELKKMSDFDKIIKGYKNK